MERRRSGLVARDHRGLLPGPPALAPARRHRLGHAAGDRSLQRFADALRESFRPNDAFVRLGGDEFLVVAPGLERPLAATRVASLRRRLAASETGRPTLRFSVGIAELGAGGQPEEALRIADELMYAAKAGRTAVA